MVKFVLPFTWVVVSVLNLLFDLALFIGDLRISGCFDWWRSENRKKHFSPFIIFSSFRMSCSSVIDDSLIDVRSFQFAEMIKLFVLSELDIPVFYWGQTWTWPEQRVTSIFAKTDESRPDLNISPLIAHLQTPLKISETIYIDKANICISSITFCRDCHVMSHLVSSKECESPGGANLPSLPSAHLLNTGQRGINERRGGSILRNRDIVT